MAQIYKIMEEAARKALAGGPLSGSDLEIAVSHLMQQAIKDPYVSGRFTYALTSDSFVGRPAPKGVGDKNIVHVAHDSTTVKGLPSLTLPAIARVRRNKPRVRIDMILPEKAVRLFNTHYARDVDLEFTHRYSHDHAAAAASRKIETEVVMARLVEHRARVDYVPDNGPHNFCVVDVGGDWRYHYTHKHTAVHVCAPFLDARDKARDARKRLQLGEEQVEEALSAVCRRRMSECMVSAPYGMAIHSVGYTMRLVDICQTMAVRGMRMLVMTMQLPEALSSASQWVDPDYDYVAYQPAVGQEPTIIQPAARFGLHKYLYGDQNEVVFSYPAGESKSYSHDLDIIMEKAQPGLYVVPTTNMGDLVYEYSIVKRVGTLIYGQIMLREDGVSPYEVQLAVATKPSREGYYVKYDRSMLESMHIELFTDGEVFLPAQLFDVTASYCLTQTTRPDFSVEDAISFSASAGSRMEANGVVLIEGVADKHTSVVLNGLAAFFYAVDRYRLMEARLSGLKVMEARTVVSSKLEAHVRSVVNVQSVFDSVKTAVSAALTDRATGFMLSRSTTLADMRDMYKHISSMSAHGVLSIDDARTCFDTTVMLGSGSDDVLLRVAEGRVEAIRPEMPVYTFPPTAALIAARRDAERRAGDSAVDSGAITVASDTLVESVGVSQEGLPSGAGGLAPQGLSDADDIEDAIRIKESGEAEREETAQAVYGRIFDPVTRRVPVMEIVTGYVKGTPTVLRYTDGVCLRVDRLEGSADRGTEAYVKMFEALAGSRVVYPERWDGKIQFGTGVLRADGTLVSDRGARTAGQSFDAVVDPTIAVRNASRLAALRQRVASLEEPLDLSGTVLRDEIAGSGKTHRQCLAFQEAVASGRRAVILASTRAAAGQALSRLSQWGVSAATADVVCTIDSFLMNPSRWHEVDLLLLDEALQMHAGWVKAAMLVTNCVAVEGYGDTRQIGFLPYTRFYRPSVDVKFPWASVTRNLVSRRFPVGRRAVVLTALRSERLYGPGAETLSSVDGGLMAYAVVAGLPVQLSQSGAVANVLDQVKIPMGSSVLFMVYLSTEVEEFRVKLRLPKDIPAVPNCAGRCVAFRTIGEAQGEDTDYSVVLRLTGRDEPLFASEPQTIVALTRHKKGLIVLGSKTNFPTLVDRLFGAQGVIPVVVPALSQIGAGLVENY